MNKLNEFFDWKRFSEGKVFTVVSITNWTDFNDRTRVLGSNVLCVISQDETVYSSPEVTNVFEKIYFRIPAKLEIVSKYIKPGISLVPAGVQCKLSGKPSGTFVNYSLSVTCEGFAGLDGKKIL